MSRGLGYGGGRLYWVAGRDYLARRGDHVTGTWRRRRRQCGENITLTQIDLADASAVERLVAAGQFDAIVHAAATVDAANSADNLRASIEDNVQAHTNLVCAALTAGCRRFLFCSTITVYGGVGAGPSGYQEPDARPTSIYGWSKLAGEEVLGLAAGTGGNFSAVSLRLAGVHGGSRHDGALRVMCDAARSGRPLVVKDPDSRFRWLLIDDLIAALDVLVRAQLPAGHHVCNLSSADTFTLLDLAGRIKMLCGSASPIETSGRAARNEVMNIDRAIALWGFAPTSLDTFLPGYLGTLR